MTKRQRRELDAAARHLGRAMRAISRADLPLPGASADSWRWEADLGSRAVAAASDHLINALTGENGTPMSQTITELQARIGRINIANGWRDGALTALKGDAAIRKQKTMLGLVQSEASEGVEEVRNGRAVTEHYYRGTTAGQKPEGVPSELADVAIRILDYCDAWGLVVEPGVGAVVGLPAPTVADALEHFRPAVPVESPSPEQAIGDLADIYVPVALAIKHAREGRGAGGIAAAHELFDDASFSTEACLASALLLVFQRSAGWGIDLEAVIEEKLAYNERRGFRHGGKAA